MKFETVLPYLREGKKIRRECWADGCSINKHDATITMGRGLLAEDWEIVLQPAGKKLEEVLPAYRDGKLIRATAIDGSQRCYIDDDRAPAYFPHWALREACWDILDEEK